MTDLMSNSGAADTPALRFTDIVHSYGSGLSVDHLSLSVVAGETVCLLGPSGCGKSTTLRLAAGLEELESGSIEIDGQLVAGGGTFVPPEVRRVGLVFQDFALFPHLSVAKNVAFGLRNLAKSEQDARVKDALSLVGMDGLADKMPNALSGGEQQRVALARALAPRPRIMLLDEPFSGLDRRLRDAVRDETLEILKAQNTAALLVTHDPEEAMRLADRIALMRDGKIVQVAKPAELYDAPVDLGAAAFFSDINIMHGAATAGRVETPFGSLTASMSADGPVTVAFRPQALRLTKGPGPLTIELVRALGETLLVDVAANEARYQVQVPLSSNLLPGDQASGTWAQSGVFVFPGHQVL
jgi:iron(III) transport system ATP-binding protein